MPSLSKPATNKPAGASPQSFLEQLKARRIALALKQNDMPMRIGISRQQYQRLESKGNPRLDTLELVASGLNSELFLIPKEKVGAVLALLDGASTYPTKEESRVADAVREQGVVYDPWYGLLGDDT